MNELLVLKVKGLCDETKRNADLCTHAYVYARMQSILVGTKYEYLLRCINNCATVQTLQKFVYNVYLNVVGGCSESWLKIKTIRKTY